MLFSGFRTYRRGADLLPIALLAAPVLWALAKGRLRAHAGLLLAAAGLLALLLASPEHFRTGTWIAERFAPMVVLTSAAALRPDLLLARYAGAALAGALLAVSAARTAVVAEVWLERQGDVAALERALAHLPPGAALLPMEHTPAGGDRGAPLGRYIRGGHGTYWHYPVLAVPWRQAFVPTLFAMRGKQPIRVLPPWNALAVDDGGPLSVRALLAEKPERYKPEWGGRPVHHLERWRERFDHVLVVNADMPDGTGPARPVPGLELVADEGFARLYRVLRETDVVAAGSGG